MRNLKKACATGLASFMLAISLVGMSADAAANSVCTHSWTVEEKEVEEWKETHKTNEGQTCTITHVDTKYNIRCRACGKILDTRLDSRTSTHSISH